MTALDTLMNTAEWDARLVLIASDTQSDVSCETGLSADEYREASQKAYERAERAAEAGEDEIAASEYGAFMAYSDLLDGI